jgi:hypothetical protein
MRPAAVTRRAPGEYPGDLTSEIDYLTVVTLHFLARRRGVTKAQIRRELLAEACARARGTPQVSRLVGLMLESRQAAAAAPPPPPNVVPFRRRA